MSLHRNQLDCAPVAGSSDFNQGKYYVGREQRHRTNTGREYAGIVIHAPVGVHEFAMSVVSRKWRPGDTLMDAGAGSGAFSKRLHDCGYRVVAVDIDTSRIPNGIASLDVDICAGMERHFDDESLDGIVALELIEHVESPIGLLQEAFRVLRPGGGILLSTPNITHPYSRLKFLLKGTLWLFDSDAYWSTGHMTLLPRWMLREHLRKVGFTDAEFGHAGGFDMHGVRNGVQRLLSRLYRPRHSVLGNRNGASTLFVFAVKPDIAAMEPTRG